MFNGTHIFVLYNFASLLYFDSNSNTGFTIIIIIYFWTEKKISYNICRYSVQNKNLKQTNITICYLSK